MLRQQEGAGETTAPPDPSANSLQSANGPWGPQPSALAAKVTPGPEECVPPVPTRRALIRGMSADSCACPSGLTSPASYESTALAKGSFSKGFQGRGARDAHSALNPLLAEREHSPVACCALVLQMQLGDSGIAADGSHLQQGDGMSVTKSLQTCPTPPDLSAQGFLWSHQSVRGHDRVLQSGLLVKPKLSAAAPALLGGKS